MLQNPISKYRDPEQPLPGMSKTQYQSFFDVEKLIPLPYVNGKGVILKY